MQVTRVCDALWETYEIRNVNKHDNLGYDALEKCDGFPCCETRKLHEHCHVRTENYKFNLNILSAIAVFLFESYHGGLDAFLGTKLVFTCFCSNFEILFFSIYLARSSQLITWYHTMYIERNFEM